MHTRKRLSLPLMPSAPLDFGTSDRSFALLFCLLTHPLPGLPHPALPMPYHGSTFSPDQTRHILVDLYFASELAKLGIGRE
jgi:hypothetical protein